MITVKEAQHLILRQATIWPEEDTVLENALGRVLAEEIRADRNYPPFNRAAMDGFALKSEDISGKCLEQFVIAGELFAGHPYPEQTGSGHCIKIMTGAAVPKDLDCIIQIEKAVVNGDRVSFSAVSVKKWLNIAREGEDCKEGDLILERNTKLSPVEIATLAVLGKTRLTVRKQPTVAILSTGDELVPLGEKVNEFQIRDSNAHALKAFFEAAGVPVARKEIVPDSPGLLRKVLKEVSDFDIVVLSGGVSMGAADYVPATLESIGAEKIFHKVKLKPGKPLWFGKNSTGTAFFGLPGNPLSCQVCFKLFIEPYVKACFGLSQPAMSNYLPLSASREKKVPLDEFFPVKLLDGRLNPVKFNGSGDITSTVGSTGIALHPAETGNLPEGDKVLYIPW